MVVINRVIPCCRLPTPLNPPMVIALYRPVRQAHRPSKRPPPSLRERQARGASGPGSFRSSAADGTGGRHLARHPIEFCSMRGGARPTAANAGSNVQVIRRRRSLRGSYGTYNTCPGHPDGDSRPTAWPIKGPLDHPDRAGGIRSLNTWPCARIFDLYCWWGAPLPLLRPAPQRNNGPRIFECDRSGRTRRHATWGIYGPPMNPGLRRTESAHLNDNRDSGNASWASAASHAAPASAFKPVSKNGHPAPCAQGDPATALGPGGQQRHVTLVHQGQHHEIHRRGLPWDWGYERPPAIP